MALAPPNPVKCDPRHIRVAKDAVSCSDKKSQGSVVLTKGNADLRGRFPLATACVEMILMLAAIGFVGYSLLPLIGY